MCLAKERAYTTELYQSGQEYQQVHFSSSSLAVAVRLTCCNVLL